MEIEFSLKIGAVKSERSSERNGYRAGYRDRRFDTRMGTMYLVVPKLRKGGHMPFFVTEKKPFASKLKQIWLQPDSKSAKRYAYMLMDEYEDKFPEAIETLENGLEDSLQFFNFENILRF